MGYLPAVPEAQLMQAGERECDYHTFLKKVLLRGCDRL